MTGASLRVVDGRRGELVRQDDAEGVTGRMVSELAKVGLKAIHSMDDGALVRFEVASADVEINEPERCRLLARVEASLDLCAPDVLMIEVAKLKAGTVAPAAAEIDVRLRMQLLVDVLAEFPADIVRAACREQRRSSRWLPTESELAERCERLMRPRLAAQEALQPMAAYGPWTKRMGAWERWGRKNWSGNWGPEPGAPGCWVPAGLLRHYQVENRPEPAPLTDEERAEIAAAVRAATAVRIEKIEKSEKKLPPIRPGEVAALLAMLDARSPPRSNDAVADDLTPIEVL